MGATGTEPPPRPRISAGDDAEWCIGERERARLPSPSPSLSEIAAAAASMSGRLSAEPRSPKERMRRGGARLAGSVMSGRRASGGSPEPGDPEGAGGGWRRMSPMGASGLSRTPRGVSGPVGGREAQSPAL